MLLIGLFVSAFAFGQISDRKGRPVQTIRGMVVDGDSKYPIPYATVRLSDKEGMGTTTDSLGRFHHSAGSRRETYGRGSVHGI
mgnify:CR=1 FL=1